MTASRFLDTLYEDLFELIFDNLTAYELFLFRRLCRQTRTLIDSYNTRIFNLKRILAPYFTDDQIAQLRRLQAETGTLISGSAAVQFFGRVSYESSDLDLYCELPAGQGLAKFLEDSGYHFVPEEFQEKSFSETYKKVESVEANGLHDLNYQAAVDGYGNIGIVGVFLFEKKVENSLSKQHIQIIVSRIPAVGAVLLFHSTCVMNIITHCSAISFFPRSTFHEYKSLIAAPNNVPERCEIGLQKYRERGWTMVSFHSDYVPYELLPEQVRRVGDRGCWIISLPSIPSSTSDELRISRDAHQLNTWRLLEDRRGNACMHFQEILCDPYTPRSYISARQPDIILISYILSEVIHSKISPETTSASYRERATFGAHILKRAEYQLLLPDDESKKRLVDEMEEAWMKEVISRVP